MECLDKAKFSSPGISQSYLGIALKNPRDSRILVGCVMLLFVANPGIALAIDFKKWVLGQFYYNTKYLLNMVDCVTLISATEIH